MGERGAVGSGFWPFSPAPLVLAYSSGPLLGGTGSVSLLGESATLADPANASYFDCPDGTAIGVFGRGDRVLITGARRLRRLGGGSLPRSRQRPGVDAVTPGARRR